MHALQTTAYLQHCSQNAMNKPILHITDASLIASNIALWFRNRRTKEINKSFDSLAAFTESSTTNGQKKRAKSPAGQAKKAGLSTVGLTPGTTVMAEIERDLEFYICQRLRKWQHLEFELSGARVQVSCGTLQCKQCITFMHDVFLSLTLCSARTLPHTCITHLG